MTLTDMIRRHLSEDIPQLLEDIETFTNMKIPRELTITNHFTYADQIKRLEQAQKDNAANLKNYIERYIDVITDELTKELARNPRHYTIDTTAETIRWEHSPQ